MKEATKRLIAQMYGAYYYTAKDSGTEHFSRQSDLYTYKTIIGDGQVVVEQGDSIITFTGKSQNTVGWFAGNGQPIAHFGFAAVLRGYRCGNKTASLDQNVNLPYINGCATRQIFSPERIGDPTLQQLTIPPHTSEQAHHIHATPRIVYVYRGEGYSIVGQGDCNEETELREGMICILDPMSPHHFRTEDSFLTVLPIHVFSSTPNEQNHPMFNGTKEV